MTFGSQRTSVLTGPFGHLARTSCLESSERSHAIHPTTTKSPSLACESFESPSCMLQFQGIVSNLQFVAVRRGQLSAHPISISDALAPLMIAEGQDM